VFQFARHSANTFKESWSNRLTCIAQEVDVWCCPAAIVQLPQVVGGLVVAANCDTTKTKQLRGQSAALAKKGSECRLGCMSSEKDTASDQEM
jgi:hypothetical protein